MDSREPASTLSGAVGCWSFIAKSIMSFLSNMGFAKKLQRLIVIITLLQERTETASRCSSALRPSRHHTAVSATSRSCPVDSRRNHNNSGATAGEVTPCSWATLCFSRYRKDHGHQHGPPLQVAKNQSDPLNMPKLWRENHPLI